MLTIEFADDAIVVNGEHCPFPAGRLQIESLLGRPDRESDKANLILTWDDLGIHAYQLPGSDEVSAIEFSFENEGFDFSPEKTFSGVLLVEGTSVTSESTIESINEASPSKQIILVEDEDDWWELDYGNCLLYFTTSGPDAVVLNVSFERPVGDDDEW